MSSTATDLILATYGTHPVTGVPYPPHPTQATLLELVDRLKAGEAITAGIPVLYVQHGVDAGGTRAILTPLLELLIEYPGIRTLSVRKDFNDLRLSIMETFFEVLPPTLLVEKDEQEHRYVIAAKGGQATHFFREAKDVAGLGSQEFAVITIHEAHELTLQAYRVLKQRCRQTGFPNVILMEGNPPSEGHWLSMLQDPKSAEYDPDLRTFKLSSYENWDFMAPAYRQTLEDMPALWKRRYVLGETCALPSGTPVYPAFVPSVHSRPTALIPDRPLLRGWDFGWRRAAALWAQLSDSGQLLVHKEWMALETPEEQFIDGVKVRTNTYFGERVCVDYGDPAARNRDPHGISTLTRLLQAGITLHWRQTTYADRIPLINKRLSLMIHGEPAIVIDPAGCPILTEALMGGYHYPEIKPEAAYTIKKELPEHDPWFSHLANAFEYLCVNIFGHSTPAITKTLQRKRERTRRMFASQQTVRF